MVKQGNTKDAVMSIPEMWEIKKPMLFRISHVPAVGKQAYPDQISLVV